VKRSQSSFPTSAFLVSYGARSAPSSRLEFENESVRISSTYFPITTLATEQGRSPKALSEALRRIRKTLMNCIENRVAREARSS